MNSSAFWRATTVDESGFLERLLDKLAKTGAPFCVIGGQAVNAYVAPPVSRDLDLAIAAADLERLLPTLGDELRVERSEPSVNVSTPGSDLRVQFQLEPRSTECVPRRELRAVVGHELPVARLEDVLAGKVWAASDPTRRASKRQKDLADIARLLERYPELSASVPREIHDRLL